MWCRIGEEWQKYVSVHPYAELLSQLKQSQTRLAPLQAVYDHFCHLGPLFLDPANEGVALKAAGELWRAIKAAIGKAQE